MLLFTVLSIKKLNLHLKLYTNVSLYFFIQYFYSFIFLPLRIRKVQTQLYCTVGNFAVCYGAVRESQTE